MITVCPWSVKHKETDVLSPVVSEEVGREEKTVEMSHYGKTLAIPNMLQHLHKLQAKAVLRFKKIYEGI